MEATDDRILEFYEEKGPNAVSTIDESDLVNYHYETIRRRTKKLAEAGLLDAIGNGVYSITGEGQEYLAGTRDLRDLEKPE